jgi:hypothetical protein
MLCIFIVISPSRTELVLDTDTEDGDGPTAREITQVDERHGADDQTSKPGESCDREDSVVRFLHISIIANIFSRRLDLVVDPTAQSLAKAVLQISDGDVGNLAKFALVDAEVDGTGTETRFANPIHLPEHIGGNNYSSI